MSSIDWRHDKKKNEGHKYVMFTVVYVGWCTISVVNDSFTVVSMWLTVSRKTSEPLAPRLKN